MRTRFKLIVSFLVLTLILADAYAITRLTWQAPVSVRIGELTSRSADISIRCNPSMIVYGEATSISGQLHNATSNVAIAYQSLSLCYRSSFGTSWIYITSVSTAFDGSFSYYWWGSASLAVGSYVVNATFPGNSEFDQWSSRADLRVVKAPLPPTLVSPGSSSSPGEEIFTLTPTFTWNSVAGADEYGLYIRDMDSNTLIFDSQARGRIITGTSYTLLPGVLQWGKHYRWNMNSHNEGGWGEYCSPLYFHIPQLDVLSSVIQSEMQDFASVTVGDDEYYVVTMRRYISPQTWEPYDYAPLRQAPDVLRVYTDTHFMPVFDRQLAQKIAMIDRANNLLKHIGKQGSIQTQIDTINTVLDADQELAEAELTEWWAQHIVYTLLDLCVYVELGQPLPIASEISSILMDGLEYYIDPQQFILQGGRALLEGAKVDYEEAKGIAEGNPEGLFDYDAAYYYLNVFYNAHFKNIYGVDAVLPRDRISENALWTIAGWIPDYIVHLSLMLTAHDHVLNELWGTVKVAKDLGSTVDDILELREFLNNVNDIPSKVAQLLEDESFPVDYTQALANQDFMMLRRWGIEYTGVPFEEIGVFLSCPAELRVYDSSRNVTGVVEGQIRIEIPSSFYYNNTITIFSPDDTYTFEVMGTDAGTYRLEALYVEDEGITSFAASDLPTSSNVTHESAIDWNALSAGEEGATILVDIDGDGSIDRIFSSDGELTSEEFAEKTSPSYPTQVLTISAGENGTTFPPSGTYACASNSSVQVNVTPDEGYVFDHWELDSVNVGSNNSYRVLMQENHALNAVFRLGIYDVAVIDVLPLKTIVGEGYNLSTHITFANLGDFTEIFNVTLYANEDAVETIGIILDGGTSIVVVFPWNTTGFVLGNYTLWAYAEPISGETSTGDNTFVFGWVVVTLPGDVNGDRTVDSLDLVALNAAYGSTYGSPKWNSNCDINGDNKVDALDLFIHGKNYGQSFP